MKFSKRKILTAFFLFLICDFAYSQFSNAIWCFGDSAGINFSDPLNPYPFETGFRTPGSCVSIADLNDSLLFYANTRANTVTDFTDCRGWMTHVMVY